MTSGVHIMVAADDKDMVSRAMALVAGRTAQSYNRRKGRRGAFWEDRYHAVPIASQEHFNECLVNIEPNMVRAGVVAHPCEWAHSDYNEIQKPRQWYVIIDYDRLAVLAAAPSLAAFQEMHRRWVDDKLQSGDLSRDERWTTPDVDKSGLAWVFGDETETWVQVVSAPVNRVFFPKKTS